MALSNLPMDHFLHARLDALQAAEDDWEAVLAEAVLDWELHQASAHLALGRREANRCSEH